MCTQGLTQMVNGNVSQSPDNIPNSKMGVGDRKLANFNEANGIELLSDFDSGSILDNPNLIFNELKRKNSDRIIIGHININFIENKFEALVALVKDKVDSIIISETKIDDSFPLNQFIMEGYSIPL